MDDGVKLHNAEHPTPEDQTQYWHDEFCKLLWDYQTLERMFNKVTGGKWLGRADLPKREWKALGADDFNDFNPLFKAEEAARWAEAKLKEKNT